MSGPLAAFIEESYQDTLSLMTDLRDFLSEVQAAPDKSEDEQDTDVRAQVIREISAVTRNLTDAMAWLLLQKAVAADEITEEEALKRAADLLVPTDEGRVAQAGGPKLPLEVRGYMDRSRRIYDQVLRLRDMTEKQPG